MALKILIADDEHLSAELMVEEFHDHGFPDTVAVFSPEAAREYIETNKPDLVFLDVNFKVSMTGIDVLEHVRKTTPETKVCILSAYRSEMEQTALDKGAYAFIGKPSRAHVFLDLAQTVDRLKNTQ